MATATHIDDIPPSIPKLSIPSVLTNDIDTDSPSPSVSSVREQNGNGERESVPNPIYKGKSAEYWACLFRQSYGDFESGAVVDVDILSAPRRRHAGAFPSSLGILIILARQFGRMVY